MRLPVVDNPECDGCGACCLFYPAPPYDESDPIDRERRAMLPRQLRAEVDQRAKAEADGSIDELLPCPIFNPVTRRCKHHKFRPLACERFQVDVDPKDRRPRKNWRGDDAPRQSACELYRSIARRSVFKWHRIAGN